MRRNLAMPVSVRTSSECERFRLVCLADNLIPHCSDVVVMQFEGSNPTANYQAVNLHVETITSRELGMRAFL